MSDYEIMIKTICRTISKTACTDYSETANICLEGTAKFPRVDNVYLLCKNMIILFNSNLQNITAFLFSYSCARYDDLSMGKYFLLHIHY